MLAAGLLGLKFVAYDLKDESDVGDIFAVFDYNGDITEEEFLDAFCKFLEVKGWHFAGLTREEVDD